MKFLLLIVVVLVVVWVMRGKRPQVPSARPAEPDAPHEAMLACAQCGLHLPKGEALPGRGGVFCSESHRSAYEHAHPSA
jgi:uncharacterized protein